MEVVPRELRQLRACLLCSLVKTLDQFELDGCDNCDDFLHLRGNREMVYECTSSNFDGIISLMNPDDSWVAKWQKIHKCVRGCYAISVSGRLKGPIVRELRSQGIMYQSRDRSEKS